MLSALAMTKIILSQILRCGCEKWARKFLYTGLMRTIQKIITALCYRSSNPIRGQSLDNIAEMCLSLLKQKIDARWFMGMNLDGLKSAAKFSLSMLELMDQKMEFEEALRETKATYSFVRNGNILTFPDGSNATFDGKGFMLGET